MPRFHGEYFRRVGSGNTGNLRCDKNFDLGATPSGINLKRDCMNTITPESYIHTNSSTKEKSGDSEFDNRLNIHSQEKSKVPLTDGAKVQVPRDSSHVKAGDDKIISPRIQRPRRRRKRSINDNVNKSVSTKSTTVSPKSHLSCTLNSDIESKTQQDKGIQLIGVAIHTLNVSQERDDKTVLEFADDDDLLIDEDEVTSDTNEEIDDATNKIITQKNPITQASPQSLEYPKEPTETNITDKNIPKLKITNNCQGSHNVLPSCIKEQKEPHTPVQNQNIVASINQQNLVLVSEVLKKKANTNKIGFNLDEKKDGCKKAKNNEESDSKVNDKTNEKPKNKSSNLKPEVDCAILKTAWFPLNSETTSVTPNLRLRVPLIAKQTNDSTSCEKELKFPCLLSDYEGSNGSCTFIVRSFSSDLRVIKESIEVVGYFADSTAEDITNLSDSQIMHMRKQQSFAALQWETQILYIIFRCTKNDRIQPSENYFPIPRSITYEKGVETIKMCLNMDIASRRNTSGDSSSLKCESVVFGTFQDVFNLHVQFNEGPMPEAIIAYFVLKILNIMSIVHSCSVTHNNLGLDSFLVVCENACSNETSSFPNSPNWGLRLIGFGAKAAVIRCRNQKEPLRNKSDIQNCTKWHFEPDLYAIADIVHLLLTGGLNMSWRKATGINQQDKIEINLKSFISKNKYLSGSLAWESLFEELLNNTDRNSGVDAMDKLLKSNDKETKDSSDEFTGNGPFLNNTVKLLKLVAANENTISRYLNNLYLHLESERKIQPEDAKSIRFSKVVFPTYFERASCFSKGRINSPHCPYECHCSSPEEEIPKNNMTEDKERISSQNNSLIFRQRELRIKTQEEKLLQREKELHDMMKNGEEELKSRRKELDSDFEKLREAEKKLCELVTRQEKMVSSFQIERHHQIEKLNQFEQEKLVQATLSQEREKLLKNKIDELSQCSVKIDHLNEENKKLHKAMICMKGTLENKDQLLSEQRKVKKMQQEAQARIKELEKISEEKSRQISTLEKKQDEMSKQSCILTENSKRLQTINEQYKNQQKESASLKKELEEKEEKIKNNMFLLMKKQDAIATLEAQLKETSEKLNILVTHHSHEFTQKLLGIERVASLNTQSDREITLHQKELLFIEKVKERENELNRRSQELENQKKLLELKISHAMESFGRSGMGLFQNGESANNYDARMKLLFDREAALLHRVRTFEALKQQCESNLMTRERQVSMLEQSLINRPNQMNLKRSYELQTITSAPSSNISTKIHREKRHKSEIVHRNGNQADDNIISLLEFDSD